MATPSRQFAGANRVQQRAEAVVRDLVAVTSSAQDVTVDAAITPTILVSSPSGSLGSLSIGAGLTVTDGVLTSAGGGTGNTYFPSGW